MGNLKKKGPENQRIRVAADTLGRAETLEDRGIDLVANLLLEVHAAFEQLPALLPENLLHRGLGTATKKRGESGQKGGSCFHTHQSPEAGFSARFYSDFQNNRSAQNGRSGRLTESHSC